MKEVEKSSKKRTKKERLSICLSFLYVKEQAGITLLTLAITILIIIILSGVTITAIVGDNGLLGQASQISDEAEAGETSREEEMNSLLQYYANVMAEDSELSLPSITKPYLDNVLAAAPDVEDGMIPVKWNGDNWVQTTVQDSEWYNYEEKEWANVVLENATFNNGILDETKTYVMLVWIPRYAYKITSQYHQSGSGAGNIDIVFVDSDNKDRNNNTYSESYPTASTGSGMGDYVVHPSFNYGGIKLNGFWVGKYETSNTDCTTTSSSGEYNGTEKTVQIKAGVASWGGISVSNIYTVCSNMNVTDNIYGLTATTDPHLIKNSEWGAVAYLSQNASYGKGEQIWINPNSNCITGQAGSGVSSGQTTSTSTYNTENGQQSSTTGNVTGVYDMSGCRTEYVASYVNNGNSSLTSYGYSLIQASDRYKDVYRVTTDTKTNNYNNTQPSEGLGQPTSTTGHYGDAIWETSSGTSDSSNVSNGWYGDHSNMPYTGTPFLLRGGMYNNTTDSGIFYFHYGDGNASANRGFRIAVASFSDEQTPEEPDDGSITADAISKNPTAYYGAEVKGYTCQSNGVDKWRIFYADENNIYLMAHNYISLTYAPKSRKNNSLNKGSTQYRLSFRNIVNDYEGSSWISQNSLAKEWLSKYLNRFSTSTNPNINAVAYLLDTNVWSIYAGEDAEYAIGAPTIELFCASYKDTHPNRYIEYDQLNQYGYNIRWNDGTYGNIVSRLEEDFNDIYKKHSLGTSMADGMWIASPSAYNNSQLYRIFDGDLMGGELDDYHPGLCPIVCLKSSVHLEAQGDGTYAIVQ